MPYNRYISNDCSAHVTMNSLSNKHAILSNNNFTCFGLHFYSMATLMMCLKLCKCIATSIDKIFNKIISLKVLLNFIQIKYVLLILSFVRK